MQSGQFCFWHDPETAAAATEARQLGGKRRRREGTLAGAYDFEGLYGPVDLLRLLNIATFDALALDNSIAKVRTLVAVVQAGAKLFEVTDIADRLDELEQVMEPRLKERRR